MKLALGGSSRALRLDTSTPLRTKRLVDHVSRAARGVTVFGSAVSSPYMDDGDDGDDDEDLDFADCDKGIDGHGVPVAPAFLASHASSLKAKGWIATNSDDLSALYISTRIKGEDIRMMMYRKWNRVFDVDILERAGRMCVAIHACKPYPSDTAAYMQKLEGLADRMNAWQVSGAFTDLFKNLEVDLTHACKGTTAPLLIPLEVTAARIKEFEL